MREITTELENMVANAGLADHTFSGIHLTWCNKQEENDRCYVKLHRILVNVQWIQELNWTSVHFLNPGISDHSPGF